MEYCARVQTHKSHAILFDPELLNGSEQAQGKAGGLVEHCSLPGDGSGSNPKGATYSAPECSPKTLKMNHISFICRHDGDPPRCIQVARQDRCVLRRSKCALTVRIGHGAGFLITKSARSKADHSLS